MDLDDELRRMFANVDDQLDVPVRPDADQVIVTGARRVRRRRIATATAGGALAVAALVVGGIALAGARPEAMPPAAERTTTVTAAPTSATTSSPIVTSSYVSPPVPGTSRSNSRTITQHPSDIDEPPVVTGEQIGPIGFRQLRLGMTHEEALATGMVRGDPPVAGAACTVNEMVDGEAVLGKALFSEGNRLETINPGVDVHTPEGVSIGWTVPEVKAVYADLNEQVEAAGGSDFVAVPGNRSAYYRLRFSDGALAGITLEQITQPCYG